MNDIIYLFDEGHEKLHKIRLVFRVFFPFIHREFESLAKGGELANLDISARDEKERQHLQNEQVVWIDILPMCVNFL